MLMLLNALRSKPGILAICSSINLVISKSPKSFNNLSFDLPNDFFTGTNEPIVTETFNRGLKKVYDMQTDLLSMSKDHYTDVYPPVSKTLDISKSEYI